MENEHPHRQIFYSHRTEGGSMILDPHKKIIRLSVLLFILLLSLNHSAFAASWSCAGPIVGYIHGLAMSPSNPDVMYVAIPNRIAKTTDGGREWNLLSGSPESEILKVEVDPNDPNVVYAGTKDGIYKSEDGGDTWTPKGLPGAQVNTIAIDPLNALIIYAGTGESNRYYSSEIKGIFKSMNGGNNWELILQEKIDAVAALLIDPNDSLSIYAGIVDGTYAGAAFRKSTDGGSEWVNSPPPSLLCVMWYNCPCNDLCGFQPTGDLCSITVVWCLQEYQPWRNMGTNRVDQFFQ